MKTLDRLLQRWRIAVAAPWIPLHARVLDVGCADGVLFEVLRDRLVGGVGLDPEATTMHPRDGVRIVRGIFPDDAPDERFDAITMLAVVEHLPATAFRAVGDAAERLLGEGGRLIATVPEPSVDRMVEALRRLRLVDGMAIHEHHGFASEQIIGIFDRPGLRLLHHRRFQLGLNNLFVFERRAGP